jgi:glycosyltransferase involved in cell wall biosynthesis
MSALTITPTLRDTEPLRIAMLAPPWISIPAAGYGGIETVIDQLCTQLVADGHHITLFAAPGSTSSATVCSVLAAAHPHCIGQTLYEADHVASAMDEIDLAAASGIPFDLVHDHSGFAALAIADRLDTPMVHTLHGQFTDDTAAFYRRHGHKATLVAISHAQARTAPPGVSVAAVVSNPITVRDWPLVHVKRPYLLWLGRMHRTKGPHRAIVAARLAGCPLVLAGPVQPGQERYFAEEIKPHLDGAGVRYVGEVGGSVKERLLAEASALLMPIRWEEPFGMVMVEALACGTPVIAFREGAARDIVLDGTNGFLVDDEHDMARAVGAVGSLDPAACRSSVRERYDVRVVAADYARIYHTVRARRRAGHQPLVALGA